MDTLLDVKRPILIKVIMTPDFRKQLIDEASDTIKRIDLNIETLKNQRDSLNQEDSEASQRTKEQLNIEIDRLFQMKNELSWKIKEVENIEDGAEVPFRVVEGSVQIKVGDDILEKMARTEVIVKDWKIVEIRNP